MELGLVHLTDPRLWGLVAESRAFYAQRMAGRGPSSCEELRAVRAAAAAPAPAEPPAVVEVLCDGGRSVPVRIHAPASGAVAGVHLQIHGGGFYLGSAAGTTSATATLPMLSVLRSSAWTTGWPPNIPGLPTPDDCEIAALWLAEHAEPLFGATKLSSGASRPARPWQ